MRPYFTRERFGRPQFLAGLLLLCFLAQALWLVHSELRAANEPDGSEAVRIGEGWKQWHGRGIAAAPFLDAAITPPDPFHSDQSGFDTEHSPLLYVASAAPLLIWPQRFCHRFGHVLALAAAHSLSCLRRFPGSIVVVCGPSPLRKYRRLHCAYPLLLFSFTDSGKRSVARRAGDCCGLGRVRRDLYRDCGSAHALRPPRSRALELAANRSAWHLARNRCGIAVLPDRGGPDGVWPFCFMSLRCAARRESSSGSRLASSAPPAVRNVLLSSAHLRREHAARRILGSKLGAASLCLVFTSKSPCGLGVLAPPSRLGFQSRSQHMRFGRARAILETPPR